MPLPPTAHPSPAADCKIVKSLSAPTSAFTKYVVPCVPIGLASLLWGVALSNHNIPWFIPCLWMVSGGFLVWWTLPIKGVAVAGDTFRITNYFRSIEVPTAHLHRIDEQKWNRTPNIVLFFHPPTAFGRKIRVLTPMAFFSRVSFEDVAIVLRDIVAKNLEAKMLSHRRTTAAAIASILADPASAQPEMLAALDLPALDELIDRLPKDSELRDLARSERQKRWYG